MISQNLIHTYKPNYRIKWIYFKIEYSLIQLTQFFQNKELIIGWYERDIYPPDDYLYIIYTTKGFNLLLNPYHSKFKRYNKNIDNNIAETHIWTKSPHHRLQMFESALLRRYRPRDNQQI
jgi:hypothetical protein